MGTFRGFDTHLCARVSRAGSHYLDEDTLRFFDAYGGRHYGSTSGERVTVVESVAHPTMGRVYRPVTFTFTGYHRNEIAIGEGVDVEQGELTTRYRAERAAEQVI